MLKPRDKNECEECISYKVFYDSNDSSVLSRGDRGEIINVIGDKAVVKFYKTSSHILIDWKNIFIVMD